jgi:DNA-binding LytR/AlgR family response regulator
MKFKLIINKDAEEEIVATVHSRSSLTQRIEEMVLDFSGEDFLLGYSDDEMRKIPFEKIECVTVLDRKVMAIDTDGKRYLLKERLRDLEDILPSYFIRINKSTIANEQGILKFEAVFSGGVDAVFRSGFRDYVSRRCFSEIRRRYEGK